MLLRFGILINFISGDTINNLFFLSGSWKTKEFKSYNFDALGAPPTCGHFHPLMKVRTEIRQVFLEMG